MSGALTMSSAAVNAEHEALLEGELSLHCLDFKPASTDEALHEAAVYVFLGEEHARRLAACWNACHGVSTEHLERSTAPPAAVHGDELVAVVGTVPDGSGFKSLDFKVDLQDLPDGTRLYAQGAGGAST